MYPTAQQAVILYISLVCVFIYIAGIVEINIRDSGYTLDKTLFAHLRPLILSADWSIRGLQRWTCSRLPTVAEFVKLTQSIVIDIQRQSADLHKVQLCNKRHFSMDCLGGYRYSRFDFRVEKNCWEPAEHRLVSGIMSIRCVAKDLGLSAQNRYEIGRILQEDGKLHLFILHILINLLKYYVRSV